MKLGHEQKQVKSGSSWAKKRRQVKTKTLAKRQAIKGLFFNGSSCRYRVSWLKGARKTKQTDFQYRLQLAPFGAERGREIRKKFYIRRRALGSDPDSHTLLA